MYFGVPGDLKIKLKCKRGRQFHTLDPFFPSTESRCVVVTDCLQIVKIFNVSERSIWGAFGTNRCKNQNFRKNIENRMQQRCASTRSENDPATCGSLKEQDFTDLLIF